MAKRPVRQCRQSSLKLDFSVSIAEAFAEQKRRMLMAQEPATKPKQNQHTTSIEPATKPKKAVEEAGENPKDEGMNIQKVTETKPKPSAKSDSLNAKRKTKRKEWQPEPVDDKIKKLREMMQEQVLCRYHRIRQPYKYMRFLERRIESLEEQVDSLLSIISEVNPELYEMLCWE